ncbi:unnamed protein product [Closterium sp. NIES-53]
MSMDAVYSVTYGSLGLSVPSIGPLPLASIGTCVVTSPAVTTAVASLSFTLDSGASQCFFCNQTTVTPLSAPLPVALADPTSGPAVARSSTTLPCLAVPYGFLTGLYIPSFSRNLSTSCHIHQGALLMSLLHTVFHQVAESGQVTVSPQVVESDQVIATPPAAVSSQAAASGQVAASCSCRSLAHPPVLWHHRLGHPSIPHLRSMASHRLVSGLPRVFASLPPSPASPCTPCIARRLRATPHSSSLRPATAPF